MNCKNCNESLDRNWKVCPACAKPIEYVLNCSQCNEVLKSHWVKCPVCQTPCPKTQDRASKPLSHKSKSFVETVSGISFEMIFVEGGKYKMGADDDLYKDLYLDEHPSHQVELNGYHLAKLPVTQEIFMAVMGNNPSVLKGEQFPVTNVSMNRARQFLMKLNQMTGKNYRLPTEAEWEYAARGGQLSKKFKYSGSNNVDDVAWYNNNSSQRLQTVGRKNPNELGIYDLSGNVMERCSDIYHSNYYYESPVFNPQGPQYISTLYVIRGGCFYSIAEDCQASRRYSESDRGCDYVGLRLAHSMD